MTTKTRDLVSDSDKVGYKRWILFRQAMEFLQKNDRGPGWSLTQISQEAGKDSKGWAGEARNHRGLVSDGDVDLLVDIAIKRGWDPTGAVPDRGYAGAGGPSERGDALIEAYDELRQVFNATVRQIDEAIGSTAVTGAYYGIKRGRQDGPSPDTLEAALELVERCRRGDIPWREPEPEPKPAPKPKAANGRRSQEQGRMVSKGSPEHDEMLRLLNWLEEEHGYTKGLMSTAAGYFGGTSAANILGGSSFGLYRLDDLRDYIRTHFHPARIRHLNIGGEPDERSPENYRTNVPASAEPETLEELGLQVLALDVLVTDHIDQIIGHLMRLRDKAPRMLRPAYDMEADELREAATTISSLLSHFDQQGDGE